MLLNDLLVQKEIAPRRVLVLRHAPSKEPLLRTWLPCLAAERHHIYNAYQQTQTPRVESAMHKADYVVSCIGCEPGKALFVGLYQKLGQAKPLSREEYWRKQENVELRDRYGHRGGMTFDSRKEICWFELEPMEDFAHWKGKLILAWPPPERAWYRWADRNKFPLTFLVESKLSCAELS